MLGRRLSLVAVAQLLSPVPAAQVIADAVIVVVSIILQIAYRPFIAPVDRLKLIRSANNGDTATTTGGTWNALNLLEMFGLLVRLFLLFVAGGSLVEWMHADASTLAAIALMLAFLASGLIVYCYITLYKDKAKVYAEMEQAGVAAGHLNRTQLALDMMNDNNNNNNRVSGHDVIAHLPDDFDDENKYKFISAVVGLGYCEWNTVAILTSSEWRQVMQMSRLTTEAEGRLRELVMSSHERVAVTVLERGQLNGIADKLRSHDCESVTCTEVTDLVLKLVGVVNVKERECALRCIDLSIDVRPHMRASVFCSSGGDDEVEKLCSHLCFSGYSKYVDVFRDVGLTPLRMSELTPLTMKLMNITDEDDQQTLTKMGIAMAEQAKADVKKRGEEWAQAALARIGQSDDAPPEAPE